MVPAGSRQLAGFSGRLLQLRCWRALSAGWCRRSGDQVRPILIFIAALIVASVVVAMHTARPATAAGTPAVPPPKPIASVIEQPPPEKSVVGTLESVSAGAAQIVVSTSGGKQTFAVESGAVVRQGSRTIKASDLQSHKGERVKVRYRESGGVKHAAWIVLAAPAAPPKKAKPSGAPNA
jgi:hypothetical protein